VEEACEKTSLELVESPKKNAVEILQPPRDLRRRRESSKDACRRRRGNWGKFSYFCKGALGCGMELLREAAKCHEEGLYSFAILRLSATCQRCTTASLENASVSGAI